MHSPSIRPLLVALVVVGAAATAAGARPVEERRPVNPDAVVTVKLVNGSVTLEGWSRNEVELTGTITGDIEDVEVSGTATRLDIEVHYPRHGRNVHGSADLLVKLPVRAGSRVHVVNAPITISKLEGDVEAEAVNGDVEVSGRPSRIEARTVNGSIEITAVSPRVEAETVGGRIVLTDVEGDIAAATVGGSIRVAGGRFERARLSSVSGTLDFSGGLERGATLEAESHSGEILLQLPANVSADFEIDSFSGDIDNAFGPSGSRRGFGPGKSVSFSTGDGDARVRVSTFSGDVRLVKR